MFIEFIYFREPCIEFTASYLSAEVNKKKIHIKFVDIKEVLHNVG